jgi:hypothetical protein
MEFDHLFICTSAGAREADALAAAGFAEGAPNTHPGQGTSCRRFFFLNAYIELLLVHDPAEAQSAPARRTRLWERWSGRAAGACPFGFGFRPGSGEAGEATFSTWEYRPPYLPAPLAIHVATNADVLTEPMLFYLPFARPADSQPQGRPSPAQRRSPHQVTRVEFVSPTAAMPRPSLRRL